MTLVGWECRVKILRDYPRWYALILWYDEYGGCYGRGWHFETIGLDGLE